MEPYPVGRLDKDTVGLLIISNDGNMCHRVLSPKRHVEKKYFVRVDTCLNSSHIEIFSKGVILEDGYKCKPVELKILNSTPTSSECEVEAINSNVLYLKRIEFCGIELDENLNEGEYRHLTDEEVNILKLV